MANKVPIVQATFYNNNTKQIENCYPMTSAKGVVMSDGKTLEESFSDKADNSNVVHKSGDEEILGRKTFDDLRANGFSLSDNGDWNRWVSAFYSFFKNQGIIQFGTEEDWSVILRNIADPEYENDAATKGYVDSKIGGDASIPVLQYGALINNNIPSVFEREEHSIANAPIYAKILSGEVQFFAAKIGGVGLFVSRSISSNKSSFELIGLDFKNLAEILITININQSGLTQAVTLSKNLQPTLTDTDGSYGQRVAELETGKANLLHQHTVADITNFPELYYDATAFFTSGAYPSDKYEELLEAVKAKKTVYATLDEGGNISYVFFTSLANSDSSSSRVLLTTVFVDGSYLYLNTFVLQPSGMTRLQENITGKANKATTLAGYGIGDAYTKSEVNAALAGKQSTLTAGNGISIEGGVIGVTAITESESQPTTNLWINPSEDEETDVTYNRSQIDAMVGAKQDALTLTVKNNGNIVLANIQGQSKEFMPATPSGDPMHYAYVAAGAEYNDTGADIVKTAPWADLADDDADKTVVHKAGYWYLNGLGDITNEQMRVIYLEAPTTLFTQDSAAKYSGRTNIPFKSVESSTSLMRAGTSSKLEVISTKGDILISTATAMFYQSNRLVHIIANLNFVYANANALNSVEFKNDVALKSVRIFNLKVSINFRDCKLLTTKSILHMIKNEAATSAITITLHADAYARAMANADIMAALEAHPNVSLASA